MVTQALTKMVAQAMNAFNRLDSWLKSSEKKKSFQGKTKEGDQGKAKEGDGKMKPGITLKSIFGFK